MSLDIKKILNQAVSEVLTEDVEQVNETPEVETKEDPNPVEEDKKEEEQLEEINLPGHLMPTDRKHNLAVSQAASALAAGTGALALRKWLKEQKKKKKKSKKKKA